MVTAGSSWRVATMRPGEDPIHHLAAALDTKQVLGIEGELASTNCVLLEATLRRGTRGLVEAMRQARIPAEDNLLILVDQFEELFRYRVSRHDTSKNEALAFVKLLMEAASQADFPIYVVLTMRSDFIGDCMDIPGLPEMVNGGQYLVPRMTRDELRSAITGPIAVGGGEITQRLVLRLLNEFGDESDQLPVLQHALMRTWDSWQQHRSGDRPIDFEDYEAVGTFRNALSMHCEEVYPGSECGWPGKDCRANVQGAHRHVLRSSRCEEADLRPGSCAALRGFGERDHSDCRDFPAIEQMFPDAAERCAAGFALHCRPFSREPDERVDEIDSVGGRRARVGSNLHAPVTGRGMVRARTGRVVVKPGAGTWPAMEAGESSDGGMG